MARIICKFGGSSLSNYQQFEKAQKIIASDARRKVIVPSAPGKENSDDIKVTDLLYKCFDLAAKKEDFSATFSLIRKKYLNIVKELGIECQLPEKLDVVEKKIAEGASSDYVASRGEYLCGILMADYLKGEFVDPIDYILFDDNGKIDPSTYEKLAKRMADSEQLYIMPGFYGAEQNGEIKTFSRGGSDISGAIAARAIKAELYENWTDVSGLLMADPRIVDSPKPMAKVTYREIRELAYMGANVFHDEAIAPVRDVKIPINIKNTNQPDAAGTMIVSDLGEKSGLIAGIAGKKEVSIFSIEKAMMNKERGFGRKVLEIFEEHGVSYEHSPTGIDSMNIIVADNELGDKANAICDSIQKKMQPDNLSVNSDFSLIATVGEEMQQVVGTAAKLFSALRDAEVNVRVIDQGSSEINIIIGIYRDDFEKAIKALYHCFVE